MPHRVVIVGGGFAGLRVATSLRKSPVAVTLIDRRNFHLFQPLLYQVATGGLSPANIATPLRSIVRKQRNCRVVLGEVEGVDLDSREVLLPDHRAPFDTLVVAAGARHSYFGRDEWAAHAPGLKTIEDATAIRARILSAFEDAEQTASEAHRVALLTFVVVGAGPTGVELAGTIIEIARHTLKEDFREINPVEARVLLVEAGDRVLPAFDQELSTRGLESLRRLGVEVLLNARVVDVANHRVTLEDREGTREIHARTILWAAGVQGSPLGRMLGEATGATVDRAGRVVVEPDFSLPGHPEVFVIGDLAAHRQADGGLLPGIAPAAMQAGKYVAQVIDARLRSRPAPVFQYRDRGVMATIGRGSAVARIGKWRSSGVVAWLLWLFVHLMFLVQFQNRLLVLLQWAWNYVTYNRSARLITESPLAEEAAVVEHTA